MTPAGRDRRCPCGSGWPARVCCYQVSGANTERDRSFRPGPSPITPAKLDWLQTVPAWEADVIPYRIEVPGDRLARPVARIVTAADVVLAMEIVRHGPSEPDDVACLLLSGLRDAAAEVGAWPATVAVRHASVAERLRELLDDEAPGDGPPGVGPPGVGPPGDGPPARGDAAPRPGPIAALHHLPQIDETWLRLSQMLSGRSIGNPNWVPDLLMRSEPDLWRAWRLPDDAIADLFGAVAAFWRADPWAVMSDEVFLELELPDGARRGASLLDAESHGKGLVLVEDRAQFEWLVTGPSEYEPAGWLAGPSLIVECLRREWLPRPMQREIARAGWEVASPEAYPTLTPCNTPGGGVPVSLAREMALALEAVAAVVAARPGPLSRRATFEWTDPSTGVRISHRRPTPDMNRVITTARLIAQETFGAVQLWEPPVTLEPSGPEGPGAWPTAAFEIPGPADLPASLLLAEGLVLPALGLDPWRPLFEQIESPGPLPEEAPGVEGSGDPDRMNAIDAWTVHAVLHFRAWLEETRGLSASTVRTHSENAHWFLGYLAGGQIVPVTAVNERDLRFFVFDWYPAEARLEAPYLTSALPMSLRYLFRWLDEEAGIRCPWAETVLAERAAYRACRLAYRGVVNPATLENWECEVYDALNRRALLPADDLGDGDMWEGGRGWFEGPGPVEAHLRHELERRWLVWRDDEIRGGLTDPEALRELLWERQRAWETSPLPNLGGRSPAQAVEAERARRREGA